MIWQPEKITKKLYPVSDAFLRGLREQWLGNTQKLCAHQDFINVADEWFRSSKVNNIQGWQEFPCRDVIMGCTHFIENFVQKHGWDGMQVLPEDYAYYSLMGKMPRSAGDLEPNKPLIVSLPNWRYADLRPEWPDILVECEEKNIDIHIDFAWITTARGIDIDLSHPCIKSFAMSMSKYDLQWNRVGLRWCRQRTMDSITLFNHYYSDANSILSSVGVFMAERIPRDYGWNTYGDQHFDCCSQLNLLPTKLLHVAHSMDRTQVLGIGRLLGESTPDRI